MSVNLADDGTDGFIAAIILAVVAVVGLTVNITAIVLLFRIPILNNSFGYLNASHLVSDCGILAAFLAWATPMAFLQSHSVSEGYTGKKIGQLSMIFWYGAIYSHLVLSLNRFIAILRPKQYTVLFDQRKNLLIIMIWLVSTAHVVIYFLDNCYFVFYPKSLVWSYPDSDCGAIIGFWLDFAYGMTICSLVLFIDCLSIFQLRKKAKMLTAYAVRARFNRDRRFFLQTLTSEFVLCLMMLSFHCISKFFPSKWAQFVLVTLLWELAHSATGFIMFYFNRELRRALCCAILGPKKNNSDIGKRSFTVVRY